MKKLIAVLSISLSLLSFPLQAQTIKPEQLEGLVYLDLPPALRYIGGALLVYPETEYTNNPIYPVAATQIRVEGKDYLLLEVDQGMHGDHMVFKVVDVVSLGYIPEDTQSVNFYCRQEGNPNPVVAVTRGGETSIVKAWEANVDYSEFSLLYIDERVKCPDMGSGD